MFIEAIKKKKSTVVRFNGKYNNFIFLGLRLLKNMDIPHIVRLNAYKMHFVQLKKYFFWVFFSFFILCCLTCPMNCHLTLSLFIFPNFHVISVLTHIMDLPLPSSLVQGTWWNKLSSDSTLPYYLGLCAEHPNLCRCWFVSSVEFLGFSGMFS